MKLKATKKEIKQGYHKILGIGYCDLQFLLQYESPFAYSVRREGWACDYYDVDGVCISTGYSPLDTKNMTKDYELVREYDRKARDLIYKSAKVEEITALLKEFISKCEK